MKKNLLKIAAGIVLLLGVAVFVALVGSGINAVGKQISSLPAITWTGYTVIFGNKADSYIKTASSANVAAFTLLVIGVVFQAGATALLFPNPKGSKKFSGFLFVVGGLMELAFAIILLCAKQTTGLLDNQILTAIYDLKLGVGVIISGVAGLVAGLASCLTGFLSWKKK